MRLTSTLPYSCGTERLQFTLSPLFPGDWRNIPQRRLSSPVGEHVYSRPCAWKLKLFIGAPPTDCTEPDYWVLICWWSRDPTSPGGDRGSGARSLTSSSIAIDHGVISCRVSRLGAWRADMNCPLRLRLQNHIDDMKAKPRLSIFPVSTRNVHTPSGTNHMLSGKPRCFTHTRHKYNNLQTDETAPCVCSSEQNLQLGLFLTDHSRTLKNSNEFGCAPLACTFPLVTR